MRKWLAAALVGLATLLGVVIPAGTANAVFSCHLDFSTASESAWAWCDYGLGGVRVGVHCWNGLYDTTYYGPWVTAGNTSIVYCGGGRVLDGSWYETF